MPDHIGEKTMLNILARIKAEPWAITPQYMELMLEIAQRDNFSPEMVAQKLGKRLENTYNVEVRNGVAILPVNGPLFRYANLFAEISGATSYQKLATDFNRAVEDESINAIVLSVDSPGGEANGVSEFADHIYQARSKKKIVAYVGGLGASAGYWITSAAEEVVISDTASVGSIGTVVGVTDTSERDEKSGVKRFEIVSTQSPYKRVDPSTDDGRARIQQFVDRMSDVFIDKVAKYRAQSRSTVLSDFGQGDLLIGADAVNAGMADRVGSFEQVVRELESSRNTGQKSRVFSAAGTKQNPSRSAGNAEEKKERKPMNLEELKAEHRDLYDQVFSEGEKAAKANIETAVAEATEKERGRIKAIDDMAMKGHEDLAAQAKFEKPITAEAFAVEVIKAEKARKSTFLSNREEDSRDLDDVGQPPNEGGTQSKESSAENEKRQTWRDAAKNVGSKKATPFMRKEG